MSKQSIILQSGSAPYSRIHVHPVVVFNVLDHHVRRKEGQEKVLGALLGSENFDTGVLEIRNCFPVPHDDDTKNSWSDEYFTKMAALHQKMNPGDHIVGWYSTAKFIAESNTPLPNFFSSEMLSSASILLMVSPDLSQNKIDVNTYYGLPVVLNSPVPIQHQFLPLPFDYLSSEHERAAFDVLGRSKTGSSVPISDFGSLEIALTRLHSTLDTLSTYITAVIDGKETPNIELGRFIKHTLSLLPSNDPSFEAMFTAGTLDTLMLIYLANITRTNLFQSEKQQRAAYLSEDRKIRLVAIKEPFNDASGTVTYQVELTNDSSLVELGSLPAGALYPESNPRRNLRVYASSGSKEESDWKTHVANRKVSVAYGYPDLVPSQRQEGSQPQVMLWFANNPFQV